MRERQRGFWSTIAAVAYKETVVIRHDRAFLGVVFMQPIMMITLFGFAISTVPQNVPWTVLDRSRSAVSRRFLEEVRATGYFLPPVAVSSYEEGRARLRSGRALALLVIPEDFARARERGQPRVQLLLDGADPLSAARVGAYIAESSAAFGQTPTAAVSRAERDWVLSRAGPIEIRQRFWFNPTLKDREFFLAAFAAMLLTPLCLSATSLALVGERENGTYEQMLSLPTTSVEIVLGKLIPYVVICYVELLIALVPSGILFGVWPLGSWVTLFLVTLPFVLASLAVGTFISGIARTSAQAVFLSVFFINPSFVLSGVMMPYQLMPDGVRHLGGILPLRWYQIALRGIVERGAGLADVALPALVLTLMFTVMLAAVAWRMKPRLG
jgi:ABC-2 type transport system permease protein